MKIFSFIFLAVLLGACQSNAPIIKKTYDLGPPAQTSSSGMTASSGISLATIRSVPALQSPAMLYRLLYQDAQQLQSFAYHRWSMPPAALLQQHLVLSFAANGLSLADAVTPDTPRLQLDLLEFTQQFSAVQNSHAQIDVQATLMKGQRVLAQKIFHASAPAASAEAPAGAQALRVAADSLCTELTGWVRTYIPARS